ncbi:hypothetical protein BKA61DRAFT_584717 [Leptodontidium sp. MPI-SDFR-AT-0119]|nr:hypothetical protein BKA61DRAFT_584717 [Leptodontidium sp. MPI-SDFR-AT-0119]
MENDSNLRAGNPPAEPASFFADHCHRKHETSVKTNIVAGVKTWAYCPERNELYHGQISDIIDSCVCCSENKIKIGSQTAGHEGLSGGSVDGDTIVVSIATAVCGAFYGPGSAKNEGFHALGMQQTKQATEIYAATFVLREILDPIDLTPDKKGNGSKEKAMICKVLVLTVTSSGPWYLLEKVLGLEGGRF